LGLSRVGSNPTGVVLLYIFVTSYNQVHFADSGNPFFWHAAAIFTSVTLHGQTT
jgi:hypothetical protein